MSESLIKYGMGFLERRVEYEPDVWPGHKQGRFIEYANGQITRKGDPGDVGVDLHAFLTHHSKNIILMRVYSNVMRASGLHDGGYMLVDRSIKPRKGFIVVVLLNGQRIVRRLDKISGRWGLVADDPSVRTLFISEFDRVDKIGVVVKGIIDLI